MRTKIRTVGFRTLIIDDDEVMLRRLSDSLRGQAVEVGGRRVQPLVDTLKIAVEQGASRYLFSEETLRDFVEVARNRYDFIVVDYTYAAEAMQPMQWREGSGARSKLDSNSHQLTLVDLKEALELYESGRHSARLRSFFGQRSQLLLRSLQHDRKKDVAVPYHQRLDNTKGVFVNCTYHQLDSFQMIYNSDGELRRQFYHNPPNGREFYRNLVVQMTILHCNSAMLRLLAAQAGKLMIVRNSLRLWLLVTFVAGGGAFISSLAQPIGDAVKQRDVLGVTILALVAIVTTLVVTVLVTYLAERFVKANVGMSD